MIASMEDEDAKVAPWQKPWKLSPYGSTPRNAVSGRTYRGMNTMLTMLTMWERGYSMPLWLTFKQAHEVAAKAMRKAGRPVVEKTLRTGKKVFVFGEGDPEEGKSVGAIREGQNKANDAGATSIIFWKPSKFKKEDANGDEQEHAYMLMKFYQVFNIEQCDEHVQEYLCPPVERPEFTPHEAAQKICEGFGCETRHGGDRAYYAPGEDRIQLPEREQFDTPEHYYTTRFHEMGHATGHSSRLGRDSMKPGQHREVHTYAEEELVAEFTACFLSGEAGIERTTEGNAAAYLRVWAGRLREDPKIVVNAAQRAQKAADLILGRAAPGAAGASESSQKAA
jgi:antirestriction protein ArdC